MPAPLFESTFATRGLYILDLIKILLHLWNEKPIRVEMGKFINPFTDAEIRSMIKSVKQDDIIINFIGRLQEVADINSLDRQERKNYEESLKVYRDTNNAFNYAIEQGLQQGLQQGLKQGKNEGLEEGRSKTLSANIGNMRKAGLDDKTIAGYLGISHEEVLRYSE